MQQLTLEQAANYEPPIPECYENGEYIAYVEGHKSGFIQGGNWQKEQLKYKARNLLGMEVWIADDEIKRLFSKYLSELLQD